MDRRVMLRVSAGSVVAGFLLPNVALAATEFPDVPGMLGDRRANEFWYTFDDMSFHNPSDRLLDTYAAIRDHIQGDDFNVVLRDRWLEFVGAPGYPRTFAQYMAPLRDHLQFLSDMQLDLFDRFYRPNSHEFVDAFAYFGQGVLFDPRRAEVEAEVHTMNRTPPVAYHGWYALQRAKMLLGIDASRWARISPVLGFAWALQSIARPSSRTPNPGLRQADVDRLCAQWLGKSIAQLDRDFQAVPYPR